MRYGPVPTGLRLAGGWRDLARLKGSKTCFGMTAPGDPQKTIGQNGSGLAKTTLTVWLSSFSTLVTSLYWPAGVAALAGSAANSHAKTTSSAGRGVPSCHWPPLLRLPVTHQPGGAGAAAARRRRRPMATPRGRDRVAAVTDGVPKVGEKLGGGAGMEPPTPGFSVLCSTN